MKKHIFVCILFQILFSITAYSENKFDTIYCKLLYNDYRLKGFSLHFDGGDQLYFTPDFFMLRNEKLNDTGFLYSDSIAHNLFNDTNYVLLFSNRLKRRLRQLNAPGKDKYNGYHFYLFDAIIITKKDQEIKLVDWPSPSSKYGSEMKIGKIIEIKKILKLTPISSKKHKINKQNKVL